MKTRLGSSLVSGFLLCAAWADGQDSELFHAANAAFALDLYRAVDASKSDDPPNLLLAPLGVSTVMSMCLAGARGETAAEIETALHFEDLGFAPHSHFGALQVALNAFDDPGPPPRSMRVVNGVWVDQSEAVLPTFQNVLEVDYQARFATANFITEWEGARETINEWVATETSDKIPELFQPTDITRDTRIVLVNATYLNAPWAVPFNPYKTRVGDFQCIDGGLRAAAFMEMDMLGTSYYSDERVEVVELPFKGNEVSMYCVLPREGFSVTELEATLDPEEMERWFDGIYQYVRIRLPRFDLRSRSNLIPPLKSLGVQLAFTEWADFSGIFETLPIQLLVVVQETFLRVNEYGVEAAAATGATGGPTSVPPLFDANRPFLVFIRHKETGTILFMGRVGEPEETAVDVPTAVADYFGDSAEMLSTQQASTPVGDVWVGDFPWVYHPGMRWIYCLGSGPDNMWWWVHGHGWAWTSGTHFPYFWSHDSGSWYYWNPQTVRTPWFYDFAKEEWGRDW